MKYWYMKERMNHHVLFFQIIDVVYPLRKKNRILETLDSRNQEVTSKKNIRISATENAVQDAELLALQRCETWGTENCV